MKKSALVVVLISAAGILVWFISAKQSTDQPTDSASRIEETQQKADAEADSISNVAVATDIDQVTNKREVMFNILGAQILQKMEGRLDNPYWHLKMLADLKLLFQKQFPENWKQELISFLNHVFPDRAEELIEKLNNLIAYEDWFESLESMMHFNSQKERRQALWEKRLELFGDEAYVIFEAALKTEQFDEKMENLAENSGTFNEKQNQYIKSIKDVFGDNAVGPDAPNKTQVLNEFLALENVQQDLREMPPTQQREVLREFRETMGLDEAALERWDQLDQERADLRGAGERYMAERNALANQYQGEELNSKIRELQDRIFGETQAKYIRNEEATGYYRFTTPQKIGIN